MSSIDRILDTIDQGLAEADELADAVNTLFAGEDEIGGYQDMHAGLGQTVDSSIANTYHGAEDCPDVASCDVHSAPGRAQWVISAATDGTAPNPIFITCDPDEVVDGNTVQITFHGLSMVTAPDG